MANMDYFWPTLQARRGEGEYIPEAGRAPAFFHQARVMGGGSSINAQIALRGLPRDFDSWEQAGARGWNWEAVLPYFRGLEQDVDFDNAMHGRQGPVPIRRVPPTQWDHFTQAVGEVWSQQGHAFIDDMNAQFGDGYAAVPFSNDGHNRWSTARSYLTETVRGRANLEIWDRTEVTRILFEQGRATGVEAVRDGHSISLDAQTVILAAGGVHSPKVLMRSGIGPADHLVEMGLPVIADLPGVGSNLQDHPSIYVSCYMPPDIRAGEHYIGPASYLRYSSGRDGCPSSDMVMISAGRSGWHSVGRSLATLAPFIGIPFSRGKVRLKTPFADAEPDVCFNFLEDERDRVRMVDAFRASAEILMHSAVAQITGNPFPSMFSERVAKISVPNASNRILTSMASMLLDSGVSIRTFLMDHFVNEAPELASLMADDQAMTDYVCSAVVSLWHPSCTCRMGAADDPGAVVDEWGRVHGVENLMVCDASIMPNVPTTNTNIPTLMVAERIADHVLRRQIGRLELAHVRSPGLIPFLSPNQRIEAMDHQFKLLIDGKLVDGADTAPVINPATEKSFADRPVASREQLDQAVRAAKAAQPAWAARPIDERRDVLRAIADRIEAATEDLAHLLTLEGGKPLRDSKAEISLLVATIREVASINLAVEVIEDSDSNRVEAHFRPYGVVAAIVPWNFPLGLIGNKLPPALLAGNTLVVRPASSTPLSAVLMGELIADVVPPGVINVICDNGGLGGLLAEHPDVAKISFTGSTETGKRVATAAIDDFKRVSLELGGNDPAIVLDDVDVKAISPVIFATSFANSGQVCYAIKRVYAQEAVYEALCSELAKLADAAIVGDGLDENTRLGPLQNKNQYETVKKYLEVAMRDGKIIAGGEVLDRPGYFIRPTIVRDIEDGSPLVDEEQFGPVLPIVKIKDEEDGIRRANASSFALGASVWSSNPERAARVASRLEAGNIWINQHLRLAPHIPLSPAKHSGIGTELTLDGVKDFAQMIILDIAK